MSFRYKTIIGIALIEAVMLGMLVWNGLYILTSSNESELIKRAMTTTKIFAASNKDAVLSSDLATLESFVHEVLKNPGIIYARVLGRDGLVLAESGDRNALARNFVADTRYRDITDGIFDFLAAIEEGGVTYGRVEIGFSVDDIDSVITEARRKSLVVAGVEMMLSAVFSLILGIYLTRSLNHLRRGVQEISAGHLGYQIAVRGKDELADTAQMFNEMSQKLSQLETERKNAEKVLIKSKAEFESIFNSISDAVIFTDVHRRIAMINPSFTNMFGYLFDDVAGRKTSLIYADLVDYEEQGRQRFHIGADSSHQVYEMSYRRKDGTVFTGETLGTQVVDSDGKVLGFVGIIRDITGRKFAENKIMAALREKEVLLQEIHHRVKNNMQIMSSLLELQTGCITDSRVLGLFDASKNRIKSMALIHEKLYQSSDLAVIDFEDYVRSLCWRLIVSYEVNPERILIETDIEKSALGIDAILPCGLVINELVSNSLKYAFPDGREGKIEIGLRSFVHEGETQYELMVSDSGVGLPADIDLRKPREHQLGLQLVTTLIEHQLQGKVDLNGAGGTQFRMRFAQPKYRKRI